MRGYAEIEGRNYEEESRRKQKSAKAGGGGQVLQDSRTRARLTVRFSGGYWDRVLPRHGHLFQERSIFEISEGLKWLMFPTSPLHGWCEPRWNLTWYAMHNASWCTHILHYGQGMWPCNYGGPWNSYEAIAWKIGIEIFVVTCFHVQCKENAQPNFQSIATSLPS